MLDKKEKILSGLIIITGVALIIYAYAKKGGLLNPETLFGIGFSFYGIVLLIRIIGLRKKYSELTQRNKIITIIKWTLLVLLIIMVIMLFVSNTFQCIGHFRSA